MAHSTVSSLAIAGAWGYIGRKFLDAASQLQLTTSVFDTGAPPRDVPLHEVALFDNEDAFYQQGADLFHLALHPEHRAKGLEILLQRSYAEPICVLCEKPMALPESPADCEQLVHQIERSPAMVLYDFPELFDPITWRILDFFRAHDDVRIESIVLQRSKDREDPAIARNQKRMVHIPYQESRDGLAFALYLLAHVQGGFDPVFERGLSVCAQSQPYQPPNPSVYPHVVDGKCEYQLKLAGVDIHGRTDFTRGASWAKRRVIKGTVDTRPFSIEVDFLEGQKRLAIDGQAHDDVLSTNSYVEVIRAIQRLRESTSTSEIMAGTYPNPAFARVTYQLSSLLWKSSWEQQAIELSSLQHLQAFDAGFAEAKSQFAQY